IDEVIRMRVNLSNLAIAQSALQADTAYKMGQEMVVTGARLAEESKTASPGRAGQSAAAGSSASMLAQGVQLQTLAQLVQLQVMSLEFQKAQAQKEIEASETQRKYLLAALQQDSKKGNSR